MNAFLPAFIVLAGAGLALSVAAHVASLFGVVLYGEATMLLHVGVFVVWLPAVLVSNRLTKTTRRDEFWKVALSGAPEWMRKALYGLFAYALANFALFMFLAPAKKHGGPAAAAVVRGFSGHWMIFYAAAFVILYSARRLPGLSTERSCPDGHPVSPVDRFCPKCGREVAAQPFS